MIHISSHARRATLACVVTIVTAVAGCRGAHGSMAAAPVRPAGPSDANIAAILLIANSMDISYAELAPVRTQRADVREFAHQMETEHGGVNGLINNLLVQINLKPVDNATSFDLRDESEDKRELMHDLSGHAFDSTYMANEVLYHTHLLAAIDTLLLPNARNPQLVALIHQIRPAVAAHLEHAERVRTAVSGG